MTFWWLLPLCYTGLVIAGQSAGSEAAKRCIRAAAIIKGVADAFDLPGKYKLYRVSSKMTLGWLFRKIG